MGAFRLGGARISAGGFAGHGEGGNDAVRASRVKPSVRRRLNAKQDLFNCPMPRRQNSLPHPLYGVVMHGDVNHFGRIWKCRRVAGIFSFIAYSTATQEQRLRTSFETGSPRSWHPRMNAHVAAAHRSNRRQACMYQTSNSVRVSDNSAVRNPSQKHCKFCLQRSLSASRQNCALSRLQQRSRARGSTTSRMRASEARGCSEWQSQARNPFAQMAYQHAHASNQSTLT